jgi:class 3 adenylate cyclase/tetratricopeptide (TPR) repeat protein
MSSEIGFPAAGQGPSEHRFLTIEFIDLVGFTDLAEQLDPEDLNLLLRRYQRLALTTMERFGGFVVQAFGDGILVYFGYPAAHGNDAERAVLAALALLQGFQELDTEVWGRTLPKLQARIGIHSGLVMIAQELLISVGASQSAAVGEAVNLASRLQAEARVGGIAISPETAQLVEGIVECRSLGLRAIKGLSRKVEVFQVMRALPGTKLTEARLRRGAVRMVGREAAIERILSRWNVARDESRCQTVAVVGDAGVGKTRLVLELSGRPEFVDATLLMGQCREIFASTPLYPVAAFLWGRVGLTVDDAESVRHDKISAYLSELGCNTPENHELVADLLGMAGAGATAAAATPQLLKQRQYQFIVSIVEQAARSRTVILWIEDAHWLDPSSAELLRDIVAAAAKLPVLVLLTMRPFPTGPALADVDERVHLEPLGLHHCLELARSVPGAGALSEEMILEAVEAAQGVPFFVEQLVISLLDEQARGPAPHRRLSGVPLMLAELMSERLDRRPGARRVAQAAACVGGAFTRDFLLTLLNSDPRQVTERLEALVDAELLVPRRLGAEIRYEFRHVLLQRMAHESMVQSERRAMHARVVEVLRDAGRGEPVIAEVLAHHLTEAGAFPEATRAWLQAGVEAARRSAHIEAVEHIRNGLGLLDKIPDLAARRQSELNLQASLMGSLLATLSATSPDLAACCERGLQLCEESSAPEHMVFPFAFGQFTFVNCRGRTTEAIALAREFLARAERGGFESERVIGHRMLGQSLLAHGEAEAAKAQLEQSLRLYVHERDAATTHLYGQNTEVHTKSVLSLTQFCLGDVDAALEVGVDGLQAADAFRHPHSTAIPMVYVGGWVFGLCDATEQMMIVAKNLLALAEQHRLYGFRAHAAAFIGWALCQEGHFEAGIPMIAKAIAAFDSVQFRLSEAGHLANLADALRRVGRLAEAAETAERAMWLLSEGTQWLEPEVRRVQALVAAARAPHQSDHAEMLLRGAVRSALEYRFPVLERRGLASLQEFLEMSGRRDAGVESRLGALSCYADLGRRVARAMQSYSHV